MACSGTSWLLSPGSVTRARTGRVAASVGASTWMVAVPGPVCTDTCRSPWSSGRISQAKLLARSCCSSGEPSQGRAQRPVKSGVQATARPRPYCHCASTGSCSGEIRATSAASLGRVTT